jgi:hypothetical protein
VGFAKARPIDVQTSSLVIKQLEGKLACTCIIIIIKQLEGKLYTL